MRDGSDPPRRRRSGTKSGVVGSSRVPVRFVVSTVRSGALFRHAERLGLVRPRGPSIVVHGQMLVLTVTRARAPSETEVGSPSVRKTRELVSLNITRNRHGHSRR